MHAEDFTSGYADLLTQFKARTQTEKWQNELMPSSKARKMIQHFIDKCSVEKVPGALNDMFVLATSRDAYWPEHFSHSSHELHFVVRLIDKACEDHKPLFGKSAAHVD